MSATSKALLTVVCLMVSGEGRGAIVSLTAPTQRVMVGSEVVFDLVITYEPGEPESLFSFGARLDVQGTGNVTFRWLQVAAGLDFDGPNGPGALMDLAPDILGVKGTIEFDNPPAVPYTESLLVQYGFEFPEVGEYTFTPREFRTLGPTEEIFVAGDGTVLDSNLSFVPLTIEVIPEPAAGILATLGALGLLAVRRRG